MMDDLDLLGTTRTLALVTIVLLLVVGMSVGFGLGWWTRSLL